jgi:hypothetical protein
MHWDIRLALSEFRIFTFLGVRVGRRAFMAAGYEAHSTERSTVIPIYRDMIQLSLKNLGG